MSETSRWVIVRDSSDRIVATKPVGRAIEDLRATLVSRGLAVDVVGRLDEAPPDARRILVASHDLPEARQIVQRAAVAIPEVAEALALVPGRHDGRPVVLATGSDLRGMIYAALELADRVALAADPRDALQIERPSVERPVNAVRGVTRLFVSDVEDLSWFHDRAFWRSYLAMLTSQRFNRFSLAFGIGHDFLRNVRDAYLLFPYPFLIAVPGYDVRAVGLPDAERERNLATLRFISEETKLRGLRFQLGLWTHGYEWIDSPHANYRIDGLSPENHAAYCRDALQALLSACPAITGVTFRVHGESGVPEGSPGFWKTVFDGIVQCGRTVEIDLHPKGIDRAMIQVALATGMPVTISPKYTAEHQGLPYQQASIRELERVPRAPEGDAFVAHLMHRSGGDLRYTRYGYADFLGEDRPYGVVFRIWPGTQRLLLWGDPALAAGFGRHASFCGCQGVELCEPLSFKGRRGSGLPGGRDAYADPTLRPTDGDYAKYLYTYRLLGRLLYDPDADPESWRRYLRHELGDAAGPAEEALAHASRILPLVTSAHLPSAANNRFWPEIYTNMPIVDASQPHPYGDTPSPKRFGTVSALDPELFARIDDFADEVVSGRRSGKYSPLRVAQWLDALAVAASRKLAEAETQSKSPIDPAFRRLAIDVAIQASLGRFFASKLRAGVAYSLWQRSGDRDCLGKALAAYRAARAAWMEVIEHGRAYRDDVTVGGEPFLRGHWADRLPAIDADLADLEAEWATAATVAPLPESSQSPSPEGAADRSPLHLQWREGSPWRRGSGSRPGGGAAPLAELDPPPPPVRYSHVLPTSIVPGIAVPIALTVQPAGETGGPLTVSLRYRHVNQAEVYQEIELECDGSTYRAAIPGAYTDSPYPLQYFFVLREASGHAWLYPGLAEDLANQPYFVIRRLA